MLMLTNSLCITTGFSQAISFSPSRIFFKGHPGETVTETVLIANSGTDVYEFNVHLEDWKRDSLGNKVYFKGGTLPNSNNASITLAGSTLKIAPGERKNFTISFTIPDKEAKQASNSMVFFTQNNARESKANGQSGVGIKTSLELGVQVFYTPFGTRTGDLKFLAFENRILTDRDKKYNRLEVKFENTGQVNKDAELRFELTNKQSGEEIKLKAIAIAIMPNDFQWAYCLLDENLPAGEYLAVAILDSGDNNNLKIAERTIYVKK